MSIVLANDDPNRARRYIAESNVLITQVDNELEHLKSELLQFSEYKCRLLDAIDQAKCVIAPIRSIPLEILSMIFFEFVELAPYESALGLQTVCKSWMQVIEMTPSVWSRIFLRPDRDWRWQETLTYHLARAGRYPLAISIDLAATTLSQHWQLSIIRRAFRSLRDHPWRSLDLISQNHVAPLPCWMRFIEHINDANPAMHLQSFCLHSTCYCGSSDPDYDFTEDERNAADEAFRNTPNLTVLEIPHILLKPSHPIFSQLTSLKIVKLAEPEGDMWASDYVLPIIRNCIALEYLLLDAPFYTQSLEAQKEFTLSHLHSLDIRSRCSLKDLFKYMKTPKLDSLVISSIMNTSVEITQNLKQFIGTFKSVAAGPPLTKLTLRNIKLSEKTLIWTLERLPSLTSLELSILNKIKGETLVETLMRAPTARKKWVCPKLVKVKVKVCPGVENEDMENLARFRMVQRYEGTRGKGKCEPPVLIQSVRWEGRELVQYSE